MMPPRILTLCLLLLAGCASRSPSIEGSGQGPSLKLVATIETSGAVAEDLSLRARDRLLLVSHTEAGTVDVFSLQDPGSPRLLRTIDLGLAEGEQVTSVAIHPSWDYLLSAIRSATPGRRGSVAFHELTKGTKLGDVRVGVEPDCVRIDPTGTHAVVANESETWVAAAEGSSRSAPGSLTLIELGTDPTVARTREIRLPSFSGLVGSVEASHGRFLERDVSGEVRMIPLGSNDDGMVEPEYVAFDASGDLAFITLQENNAVVVLETRTGRIAGIYGLGATQHAADLKNDGQVRPEDELIALREPDGIAVTPGGDYFVTADEGDTKPGPGSIEAGQTAGGGRTVSVFDADTGEFLGDTGAQLDQQAAEAGLYPDERSEEKGSEPEILVTLSIYGVEFAAVGLERANAVALVDLSDPAHPEVVSLASLGEGGPHGPEGIVHFHDTEADRHFLYTANEMSGTLSVLRIEL